MSIKTTTIGDIIRRRRKACGLTMRQVLDRGGPSIAYQCDVEKGNRSNVGVAKLIAWCNAMGCEPITVFEDIIRSTQPSVPKVRCVQGRDVEVMDDLQLRDWFAGMALGGVLSKVYGDENTREEIVGTKHSDVVAKVAYKFADAMMLQQHPEEQGGGNETRQTSAAEKAVTRIR